MEELPESELRDALQASLSVQRWVDEVASAGPFDSLAALLAVARDAATPLTPAEIGEALARHPRIGEKPVGLGTSQDFSRAEQASIDADDADLVPEIADGNAAYERRFGRIFLVRAAGRTRREILALVKQRLELEDDADLAIVGGELRDIALLRLRSIFTAAPTAAANASDERNSEVVS